MVSSAILFSDYGIPLIPFVGHHYRIRAIIDSMVGVRSSVKEQTIANGPCYTAGNSKNPTTNTLFD